MRRKSTIPSAYFENMYKDNPDPWNFDSSAYERDKYAATIAALPKLHYLNAFEIGCSNGALSLKLSDRCDHLLSIDTSQIALDAARQRLRLRDRDNVTLEKMQFPSDVPRPGDFDLIVLSEVVYYWGDDDIRRAGDSIGRLISQPADIILVHWTGETDYPQSADEAVDKLAQALPKSPAVISASRTDHYRLDLWQC